MTEKIVTEDDIAAYLLSDSGFFERYPDVLTTVRLTSPRGQRSVSLQERQMELLRDKIKGLELRMANLIRVGSENDQTYQKMQGWLCSLLQEKSAKNIPDLLISGLQTNFNVPQVGLRAWRFVPELASSVWARPVSNDTHMFIKSMNGVPYCGRNPNLELVSWLDNPTEIRSVAILPLHRQAHSQPFGLIVMGSPDANRFTEEMGVDILKNMATFASAVLMRCTLDEVM